MVALSLCSHFIKHLSDTHTRSTFRFPPNPNGQNHSCPFQFQSFLRWCRLCLFFPKLQGKAAEGFEGKACRPNFCRNPNSNMNYSPDFTMPIWIRKRIRKRCREKWSKSKREYRALPMDLRRVLFQNILQSPWCEMKRKRMREKEIFRFSRSLFFYGLEFQKTEGERII